METHPIPPRVKVGVVDVDNQHVPWYLSDIRPRREREKMRNIIIIHVVYALKETLLLLKVGALPPGLKGEHG
jgi:hypothetical protein